MEFILFLWTSLFFGYLSNEAYHTLECRVHSEGKLLLFSAFSAWHYFGIWISFISQIMFLVFQQTKATPCVSSFFDDHMATLMCLHLVMNEGQLTYLCSLKIHHVLISLAGSSLVPNMVEGLLLRWRIHD